MNMQKHIFGTQFLDTFFKWFFLKCKSKVRTEVEDGCMLTSVKSVYRPQSSHSLYHALSNENLEKWLEVIV